MGETPVRLGSVAHPRDRRQLTDAIFDEMAGYGVSRTGVRHVIDLLHERGYLTFEKAQPNTELGPEDSHYLVRAIEEAGFKIRKATVG